MNATEDYIFEENILHEQQSYYLSRKGSPRCMKESYCNLRCFTPLLSPDGSTGATSISKTEFTLRPHLLQKHSTVDVTEHISHNRSPFDHTKHVINILQNNVFYVVSDLIVQRVYGLV